MNRVLFSFLLIYIFNCISINATPLAPSNFRFSSSPREVFVSPNGSSSNKGTESSPWSVNYALSNVGAGNIITLLSGTYPSIEITDPNKMSGITIRAKNKWAAKIVGSPGKHGVATEVGVKNVTIDGLQIAYSYIDGVKFNDHNSTVRNCWIHHSGQGGNQPRNTTGEYSGQGVAAHRKYGTRIEFNLLENNGVWRGHDHGIYASGTNIYINGNICRGNVSYGIQLYENSPYGVAETRVINNLLLNNGVYSDNSGLALYTYDKQTNYFINNTVIETVNVAFNISGGVLVMVNNIIISNGGSLDQRSIPSKYFADYNISNLPLNSAIRGLHDVVSADLINGFVSVKDGKFWLKSTSPARNIANPLVYPGVDFWGNIQLSVKDAGAFQFSSVLENDSRILDPSDVNTGADYWK